jgi:hypothetical protein
VCSRLCGRRALASKAEQVAVAEHWMDEPLIWPGADAAPREGLSKHSDEWMTMATILFERQPILMKEPPAWEAEFREYQARNKEVMHERNLYATPQYREADALASIDGAEKDRADASGAADDPLVVSARTLPADVTGDRRTSARALSERMYLLVKARDSLQPKRLIWQFPTVRYRETRPSQEEGAPPVPMTMRRTLIEGLINYVGDDVSAYPVGNAPVAHLCFELPPQQQQKHDTFGKKVFFYRIQYLGGDLALNRKRIADFAWVTKDELEDYFPKSTVSSQPARAGRTLSISPHSRNAMRPDHMRCRVPACAAVVCARFWAASGTKNQSAAAGMTRCLVCVT